MDHRIIRAACCAAVSLLSASASATPYASAVTESAGVVTYTLNEGAGTVTIIRDGTPEVLGAQTLGSHTFNRNGATNYSIVVSNTAAAGWQNPAGLANVATPLLISDDLNIRNSFFAPRGIAINRNPSNGALFGRVYVGNATVGTTGGFPTAVRTLGDGIYINGADGSDPTGQGDTARTAGIDFATGTASSPWRLAIDAEGALYIADWADATGTVHRTDANVTTGGNLLTGLGLGAPTNPTNTQNHGSVAGLAVTGSATAGNLTLYTIDEDLTPLAPTASQMNSLWTYSLGSTTSAYSGLPTQGAHPLIDNIGTGGIVCSLQRGPDGKFYMMQFRSNGDEAGVFVVGSDGSTVLYSSRDDCVARGIDADAGLAGIQDVIRQVRGMSVSEDGQWMTFMKNSSDVIMVPLIDGIPDLPNRLDLDAFDDVPSGREIGMDAVGNVYALSSGNQAMRVFGQGRVSVTTYNSNGTFVTRNEPEWDVTAGGDYATSSNWLLGYVPNGKGEIAKLGSRLGAAGNVNLSGPVSLGMLKIDSANSYAISGSTLTLDSFGEPRVIVSSGSHSITAPVIMQQNTQFHVQQAGSTLTVSNLSAGAPTVNVVKSGSGVLSANNYRANALTVTGGTAKVLTNGTATGTSKVTALNVTAGAKFDVNNNDTLIDYSGTTSLPATKALLISGYNAGAWNGSGIISSAAAASPLSTKTAIGYAEASALGLGVFSGQTVDGGDGVVLLYTLSGDATMDRTVNGGDFNVLGTNFGGTGKDWTTGDFTYDGSVNGADFNALASNFGKTLSSGPGASVPEPAALGLLGLGAMLALRRRR